MFTPEPATLQAMLKLPPEPRTAWLEAFRKELKTLIEKNTFDNTAKYRGEKVLPVKAIQRTKIKSDGTVDKLKVRIAIRGDLDPEKDNENNWAPTASFRLLSVFLGDAAKNRKRIYQIDFIGAYLQAYMD
jgi:hypothetical protein